MGQSNSHLYESTKVVQVRTGGRLSYIADVYKSGNASTYYQGYYRKRKPVAIRKMRSDDSAKEIQRDIDTLLAPGNIHENFIRFIDSENDDKNQFTFIATELCLCSVADLFGDESDSEMRHKIRNSLGSRSILRQSTEGLAFLHGLGFVHRNLKPSNFLIAQVCTSTQRIKYVIKLTDFRMSKDLRSINDNSGTSGTQGWVAPEVLLSETLEMSLDNFILGCFFFFVLSGGLHPFGNTEMERMKNIQDREHDVYQSYWQPSALTNCPRTAFRLIQRMIRFEAPERPSLEDILQDEYFSPNQFYRIYDPESKVRPGLCVIFNQETFQKPKVVRKGSSVDCDNLEKTFMSLGYDIIVYKDLSAKRIRKNIKELVESDFEGYASLIVCLLSHGEEGTIFGSDWLPVRINDLKFAFNSHDCPSLHGKPKIFIVQACQGYSYQTPYEEGSKKFQTLPSPKSEPVTKSEADTVPISPPAYSASWKGPDQQKNPSNSLQHNQQTLTHPPIMDLFDIIATIPEHVSFRDTEQGSYLIQSLCAKLREEYAEVAEAEDRRELSSILNDVQIEISHRAMKQTIEWRMSTRKLIRFQRQTGGRRI